MTEVEDVYAEWIFASKRILLDILEAFPSAKPLLGIFFAAVALCLQSRLYSIPSSPKMAPDMIYSMYTNTMNSRCQVHRVEDSQIVQSYLNIIIVGYLIGFRLYIGLSKTAIVDLSVDAGREGFMSRRLPSECIGHVMPNGFSK
ncbi:NADPH-cytochrome P450 reductase-like protein, partial [Tanacetum coccineum]